MRTNSCLAGSYSSLLPHSQRNTTKQPSHHTDITHRLSHCKRLKQPNGNDKYLSIWRKKIWDTSLYWKMFNVHLTAIEDYRLASSKFSHPNYNYSWPNPLLYIGLVVPWSEKMEFLVTIKPVIAQDRTQNIKEKESLQQNGNLMKLSQWLHWKFRLVEHCRKSVMDIWCIWNMFRVKLKCSQASNVSHFPSLSTQKEGERKINSNKYRDYET